MCDGGQLGFSDGLRQCQSKGHVHRNTEGVFGDQQVNFKFSNKFMQLMFQQGSHVMHGLGDRLAATLFPENTVINP